MVEQLDFKLKVEQEILLDSLQMDLKTVKVIAECLDLASKLDLVDSFDLDVE